MANSHQVKSNWEAGELVFRNLAGTELLRLGAAGVTIAGNLFPTDLGVGTAAQQLTTDGVGEVAWVDPTDGVA